MTLSNPVVLPAKKGHATSYADATWAFDRGWEVEERRTGRKTARHVTEEQAIRAARRREWVK